MTLLPAVRPGTRPRVDPLARPRLDWVLVFATAAILVIGTLLVWSSTAANDALTHGHETAYLRRHLANVAIGLALAGAVLVTDHRWVRILAPLVYAGSVAGLLLVLVMGSTINGSRSWIVVGGLSLQPAEFAKLAVVVGTALLVAERLEGSGRRHVGNLDVVLMLAIAGLPAVLAAALLFITPLSFMISVLRNSREIFEKLAFVLGLVIGPVLAYQAVELDLMWTGIIGGLLAYGFDRLRRARTVA